jgi:hypothetical protein
MVCDENIQEKIREAFHAAGKTQTKGAVVVFAMRYDSAAFEPIGILCGREAALIAKQKSTRPLPEVFVHLSDKFVKRLSDEFVKRPLFTNTQGDSRNHCQTLLRPFEQWQAFGLE